MTRPWHGYARAVLLALCAASCGGSAAQQTLRSFRLEQPRRAIGQPVWLADFTTDELFGRLSPDGRYLAYAGAQKGSLDIWIKDLTTGLPRRLTRHVATDTQPSWSPDGRRLVFVSMRHDAKGDIYLWDGGADDNIRRLTGRATADAYPALSADGRAVYFAAGPEGRSRIVRRELDDDRDVDRSGLVGEAVTGWGATHPAPSPDGRYLAYTRFDDHGMGRIAVKCLTTGRTWLVTAGDHHAGFPCFSPDSRQLLFSRFRRGAARQPLGRDAVGSLWQVDLRRALAAPDPRAALSAARPLTSDRQTMIFAQAHRLGVVFTAPRGDSLDVGLMPSGGLVPQLPSAAAQRALAAAQADPWDELLCLERVWSRRDAGELAGEARYRASTLWRQLGEHAEAGTMLRWLVAERVRQPRAVSEDVAALARIDLLLLDIEQQQAAGRGSRAAEVARSARSVLSRLASLAVSGAPRVAAHRLLRTASLLALAGQRQQAIASYEQLIARYPQQRALGAEAKLQLGDLFSPVREPDLLADYFLTIFDDYPRQHRWLRRAAAAVIEIYRQHSPAKQVEKLRRLIDAHPGKAIFCALAQRRVGELYEQLGRLDLAIEAMHQVTRAHPKLPEATAAAFELGRLSLAHSESLRQQGRLSEALQYYTKARAAYERVVQTHEPAHEARQRAHREYVRLGLLEAIQLERDGEQTLAVKRYQQLVVFDPEVLQAHRRLIAIGVVAGRRDALADEYRALLDRRDGDPFVGHYGLGYLATTVEPLSASALDEAERHLRRAVDLRPQSPFGHMTLGWVLEMRERFLGQTRRGWLEEAIVCYQRAHALNDAAFDRQTEADLLVNLCNSFANLGNGWAEAYELCDAREQLKLPFLSARREAHYRLIFGRAASATGHHRVAAQQLDQALEQARRLGSRQLEGEVLARMALSAHLRGEYRESVRLFRQAIDFFSRLGRREMLAGLTRSVAYNQLLLGEDADARRTLVEATRLLRRHGAPPPQPAFTPIGGFGRSTAPFGFTASDERNAQRALAAMSYERAGEWTRVRAALRARIDERTRTHAEAEDTELEHELLQLADQLAAVDRQLGNRAGSVARLERAIQRAEKLQLDTSGAFEPVADLFAVQVALALNLAEDLCRELAAPGSGRPELDRELARRLAQLHELETRRARWVERNRRELLPERLRLALWGDLAALSLASGLRRAALPDAQGGTAPAGPRLARDATGPAGSPRARDATAPVERPLTRDPAAALQRALQQGQQLVRAVSLFRDVERATRPRSTPSPDDNPQEPKAPRAANPDGESGGSAPALGEQGGAGTPGAPDSDAVAADREDAAAADRGTVASLWRPLSPLERLRWHVRAGFNLAQAATALSPLERLQDHPSTGLLEQLADICRRHDLGALRFVVAAELALRRMDHGAMQAAVDGFVARSPLLLGSRYHDSAGAVRHQIFSRAVQLALVQQRTAAALAHAERWERRAFVDELVALWPRGAGRLAPAVGELLEAGRAHARLLDGQDPTARASGQQAWQRAIDRARGRVDDALRELERAAPRVAALFRVEAFPLRELREALDQGDLLVTALVNDQRAWLVTLRSAKRDESVAENHESNRAQGGQAAAVADSGVADGGEVGNAGLTAVAVDGPLWRLRTPAGTRALGVALAKLTAGATRVYLDLGRLGLPRSRLSRLLGASAAPERVWLDGCWELIDARAVRRPPLAGGLVVGPDLERARQLARQLGLATPRAEELQGAGRQARRLEEAGALVWTAPVQFDGGSAANFRFPLPHAACQPAASSSRVAACEQQQDLSLARQLGIALRGQLLVLAGARHTPGRERPERIALARLVHAAGIPALLILDDTATAAKAQPGQAAAQQPADQLAARLSRLGPDLVKPQTTRLSVAVATRGQGLWLAGDGGVAPARARRIAAAAVATELQAGSRALAGKQFAAAVEHLRHALAAMALVGDEAPRDQVLDELARAYTLQEDYGRAVVQMQRLLELRQAGIDAARAKKDPRGLLVAQAQWVKALMSMGWIRLRNEQYDEALRVNAQAIALYEQVKRPLMAGPAYEQRSIIAEKKGDVNEALRAARMRLQIAKTEQKNRAAALARKGVTVSAGTVPTDARSLDLGQAVADAATRVARLLRMRFSDYRRALQRAQQALDQLAWATPEKLQRTLSDFLETRKRLGATEGAAREALAARLGVIREQGTRLRAALVARVETLLEIARIDGARGDYGGAVDRATSARDLAIAARLGDEQDVATLEVVNNLYYMGAYQRALEAADAALQRAREQDNRLRQIQFHNLRGTVYAALGKTRQALRALRQALRIAEQIGRPAEIAASHNNIGDALRRAGRYLEAHESFSRALVIDREREDKLGMSFDFANLGLNESLLGRDRQARADLERAIALSQEIGAPLNELKARVGIGRLELRAGRTAAAEQQFAAGLRLARELGLRNWLWRFLLWTGRAARARDDRAAARRALTEAVRIVEVQPPRLRPVVDAHQVEAQPDEVYDELIDLLAEEGQAAAAFDLSERWRARSFIDLVSRGALDVAAAGRADLRAIVTAQIALEAARTGWTRAAPASEDRALAAKEIADLDRRLAAASERLTSAGQRSAALADLVRVDAWPHAQLVPLLERHPATTVVSYFVGRQRLLVWVLSRGQLKLRVIEVGQQRLTEEVALLRRQLVEFHPVETTARRLYRWLIQGVFGGAAVPDRLVVVPSGPLHLLPFGALHDGRDFLVGQTVLSQLPSVNELRRQAEPASAKRASRGQRALSLALPQPSASSNRMPFVAHEAAAFGHSFAGAEVLLGQAATRAELARRATETSLLHIATHAHHDPDAPLSSNLALADGPLDLGQVFALDLGSVQLAILSACETGLGPLAGADGILGLHRAFLGAGARRVVSSLWRVSDLGTALLMKHLFRGLAAGRAPAAALRDAQQQVRGRFAHPAFWAGFRLDGAP